MRQKTNYTHAARLCGMLLLCTATAFASPITGFVWNDLNRNGIQDGGEPGLDSVLVHLQDTSGNVIDSVYTDSVGNYSFDVVAAGLYVLHFDSPDGLVPTLPGQGTVDTLDSDINALGETDTFTNVVNMARTFDAGFATFTLQCPNDITVATIDSGGIIVNFSGPEAATGCPNDSIIIVQLQGPISGDTFPLGITTICFTISDSCDNADTCCFNVTVLAAQDTGLAINCPANITVNATPGSDSTVVNYTLPTGETSCSGDSVSVVQIQGPASGGNFGDGVTQVCFALSDTCGNSDTCCFTVTVMPDTASVGGDISGFVWLDQNTNGLQDGGEPGLDSVLVRLLDSSDSSVAITYTDSGGNYSFDSVATGTYSIHFANPGGGLFQTLPNVGSNDAIDSDADAFGLTDTFSFVSGQTLDFDAGFTDSVQGCFTPVTVEISNIQCDSANGTFTFVITASGGTGAWGWDLLPDLMMVPYDTPVTLGPYPIANGPVTLTINDHDNPACTATFTVDPGDCGPVDTTFSIVCPDNITVNAAGNDTSAVVTFVTPSVSTACLGDSLNIVQTQGPASGGAFPIGTSTVCFSVSDTCGNSGTCCFQVTVLPPADSGVVFSNCSSDITITVALDDSTAVVSFNTPTATTNCPGGFVSVVQIQGPASGDTLPLGNTEICFVGTDNCGNSDTCCFTISVVASPDSGVVINCPQDITLTATGGNGVAVSFNDPIGFTSCAGDSISVVQTQGPASGAVFPVGNTEVCFTISDTCGNADSCCFTVTVLPQTPGAPVCDEKTIGCIKYELLGIDLDADKNRTYSIRVTNNCTKGMIYTAFQIPDGVNAIAPLENSIYTTPGGREYDVRNPNFSPFYSIRFKSRTDSISGGESDIFEYTLPPQAAPDYIHVITRVYPKVFYETHLNTFDCVPTSPTPHPVVPPSVPGNDVKLSLYPNPSNGTVLVDLSPWKGQVIKVAVLNSQGQVVHTLTVKASEAPLSLTLSSKLSDGLYFVEIVPEQGQRKAQQFLLQH